MESHKFRTVAVGDSFRLDGRIYEKRSNYSALLIQLESGDTPRMKINRMIGPDMAVESATDYVDCE